MTESVYIAGIILAVLAFVLVPLLRFRSSEAFSPRFFFICCLFSLVAAFVFSRGNVYLFGGFMTRMRSFFSLNPFDYSVMGTLLGIVLGTLCAARLCGVRVTSALDLITPGTILALAIARFSEGASDFGWGGLVFEEHLQFFPLCVKDIYGQFHLAVFFFEGIAALFLLFTMPLRKAAKGECFVRTFCRFMLSQIFFESLRAETLRIGFVRVQQVECAVFVLVMILIVFRTDKKTLGICTGIHLGAVGICAFCEYALDKISVIPAPAVYFLMALALIVCGCVLERYMQKTFPRGN